jgi:hypothetical protein
MNRNTAGQRIGAQMVSATDGSAFTGTVTVRVTGDAGTQALGSVGSGVCVHEGNGYHTYAPAQAETNFALIGFTFTGTGAVPATVQVYTNPDVGSVAGDILGDLVGNLQGDVEGNLTGSIQGDVQGDLIGAIGALSTLARQDVGTEVVAAFAPIQAKTDLLPDGILKNSPLSFFKFLMIDELNHVSPKTGLVVTAERAIDAGTFSGCANVPAEVGSGIYRIDLAASDLNGDVITLKFTATGADTTFITLVTQV